MFEKIRIEEDGESVTIWVQDGTRFHIKTHYIMDAGESMCTADLSLPKALELHRALGKMLGVEDKLLDVECQECRLSNPRRTFSDQEE